MRTLTILVVDDDPWNQEIAQVILAGEGHRVELCANGCEALALAQDGRRAYDAILMDVNMPAMDGLEATRRLKASPQTQAVPVIVVSGSVEHGDAAVALAAGAERFVRKPYRRRELLEALNATLEGLPTASDMSPKSH